MCEWNGLEVPLAASRASSASARVCEKGAPRSQVKKGGSKEGEMEGEREREAEREVGYDGLFFSETFLYF